jgi:hypothetical protein
MISAFNPDFDAPIVESPSPIDASLSDISGPSSFGPFSSLPSPSSYAASENSVRTIIPGARLMEEDLIVEELTLPGIPEGSMLLANDGAKGSRAQDVTTTAGAATDSSDHDLANIRNTDSTSDLYTNRAVIDPPMPTAKVGPDGRELRFDLTSQLGSAPATVRPASISFLPVSSATC